MIGIYRPRYRSLKGVSVFNHPAASVGAFARRSARWVAEGSRCSSSDKCSCGCGLALAQLRDLALVLRLLALQLGGEVGGALFGGGGALALSGEFELERLRLA